MMYLVRTFNWDFYGIEELPDRYMKFVRLFSIRNAILCHFWQLLMEEKCT